MAWYRLHDSDPNVRGVVEIEKSKAREWNSQGFGIFTTVNEFDGPRRIANLKKIRAWAVDIDEGEKEKQLRRIERCPVPPSLVVETKRGYQVYWRAKDGDARHWNAIVLDRLVPYFGADRNARDIARILRVPGYYHLKDPNDPFLVRTIWRWPVAFTELQMAVRFTSVESQRVEELAHYTQGKHEIPAPRSTVRTSRSHDDFWREVYELDCGEGLRRLSGHPAVGGESYTLKRNASGTQNVFVDGKGTSCWIDKHGRIGSLDKGGPTLYQWLRWFGTKPRECVRVLKDIFPHLEDVK